MQRKLSIDYFKIMLLIITIDQKKTKQNKTKKQSIIARK